MRFLQPAVSEVRAWNALHFVRFRRVRRLLRRLFRGTACGEADHIKPQRAKGRVPYLELVWLPHYLVTFQAVIKDRVRRVEVIVGANEPTAAVIDLEVAKWETHADRERFPATISEDDALVAARRAVLEVLLRSPGLGRKPEVSEMGSIELVQYPLWVYYVARRRDILDVKILDAVTGRPTGTKAKLALLGALAAAHQSP
jgi:hypothetical protein